MHATKTTRSTNRRLLAGTFTAALALTACQNLPGGQPDDQGTISLAVSAAPAGVACLRVTTTGTSRSVARTISVTPGVTVSTSLSGLPTGSVSVLAEAFAETCAAVSAMSVATLSSDPFTVTLAAGVAQPVQLTMRQNGRISVSVDWDTSDGTGGAGGVGMTGAGGAPGMTGMGGAMMTGAGGAPGMTGTGGGMMTGAGGAPGMTGMGGAMTGMGGTGMTGAGGSTGGGCPGCARLSAPLTASNQFGEAIIDFSAAPFDGTNATLSARVCVLSGSGGAVELVVASGTTPDVAGTGVVLASTASCAMGFTNITFALSSPGQGMFNPAAINAIAVAVVATDPGPWANPTIIQIDSISVSNNVVGPFNFDASTDPLIATGSVMSSLSWIGP